jgi:ABC-2 type transport system ATP-binding protein
MRHRRWLRDGGPIGSITLIVVLAACSSSSKASSPTTSAPAASSSSVPPTTVPGPNFPTPCVPPTSNPKITATRVAVVASDWTLTSFDKTAIRIHWFPLPGATTSHPAPTVLVGPGWGAAGDTNLSGGDLFGAVGIGTLRQAGYNVLTWDPRGFGKSAGTVEIDSADFEGRDVEAMLDWISTQPGVQLDGPRDPRVGMAGASYGGGIQLIAAAIDCRIDAITPTIAWHSLTTSLFKADTPKSGWSGLLNAVTAGRSVDAHIRHAYATSTSTALIDSNDRAFFASRGPGDLVSHINVPTLIVQGTVDNLFTLDEGIENYRILRARGVPTAMVWFCGGHGVCLTNPGAATSNNAVLTWLNRYVKQDTTAKTGARFTFIDQNGNRHTAADYPVPTGTPVTATGSGTLQYVATGGSGPAHPAAGNSDPLAGVATSITPAQAPNAVDVKVDFAAAATVIGTPQLKLSYTGTAPAGTRPTRVFAQIVDDSTGIVLGNQVTPIEVTLDGKPHQLSVPLETVVYAATAGAHVTLQLVATTVAYAQPRLGGRVTFDSIRISLPIERTAAASASDT